MFGNFSQQFGLNFNIDPQGGLFGPTEPGIDQPPLGGPAAPSGTGTGTGQPLPGATVAKAPNPLPGAIQPQNAGQPIAPQGPALGPAQGAPSPLASPMAPGQPVPAPQPQNEAAPAAGIGSQFGNGVLSGY